MRSETSSSRRPAAQGFYNRVVKRLLDLLIALFVLLLFFPLLLLIALAVRLDSTGPALFRQERLGRNGKTFQICKFRTMVVNAEHTGSGVYSNDADPRQTRVGRFLRKTSLDELPQVVWNVLRGEMSLIGPRPPLTYHPWPLEAYTPEQRRMFEVRPGLTGWAQIHGRKGVEWNERIRLNVWYVDHVSFPLDIKIFFKTIGKVFSNADNENMGATVARKDEEAKV